MHFVRRRNYNYTLACHLFIFWLVTHTHTHNGCKCTYEKRNEGRIEEKSLQTTQSLCIYWARICFAYSSAQPSHTKGIPQLTYPTISPPTPYVTMHLTSLTNIQIKGTSLSFVPFSTRKKNAPAHTTNRTENMYKHKFCGKNISLVKPRGTSYLFKISK